MTILAEGGRFPDCQNPACTRMGFGTGADFMGVCVGYHCPKCGLPCSSHGHNCEMAIRRAWREERGA